MFLFPIGFTSVPCVSTFKLQKHLLQSKWWPQKAEKNTSQQNYNKTCIFWIYDFGSATDKQLWHNDYEKEEKTLSVSLGRFSVTIQEQPIPMKYDHKKVCHIFVLLMVFYCRFRQYFKYRSAQQNKCLKNMQKGWPTHGSCDIICGWKLLNLFNYAVWLLFVLFIPYHYNGENTPWGVQVNFPKETYSSDQKRVALSPAWKITNIGGFFVDFCQCVLHFSFLTCRT